MIDLQEMARLYCEHSKTYMNGNLKLAVDVDFHHFARQVAAAVLDEAIERIPHSFTGDVHRETLEDIKRELCGE